MINLLIFFLIIIEILVFGLGMIMVFKILLRSQNKFTFYDTFILGTLFLIFLAFLTNLVGTFHNFAIILHSIAAIFIVIVFVYLLQNTITLDLVHISKHDFFIFVGIIILSLITRTPTVNFLPMIGDSGEYVNTANQIVNGGNGISVFFPLTKILLAIFSYLFGSANIGLANLFFSIFTLISFWKFFLEFFDKKIAFTGVFLLSINIWSMYLSRFQYAEIFMLFFNINILFYSLKFSKNIFQPYESRKSPYLTAILIMFACLTRITGLIWVIIHSVNFLIHLFFVQKDTQKILKTTNIIWLFYFITLLYGLIFHRKVYVSYIDSYIPNIQVQGIIILNIVCFASLNLLFFLNRKIQNKFPNLPKKFTQLGKKIKTNQMFLLKNILLLITIAILGIGILTLGIKPEFINRFFAELPQSGLINQIYVGSIRINIIYLIINYFSPLFLIVFPLAFIKFYQNNNFFLKPTFNIIWLFIIINLIYYNFYRFTPRDHAFYMYWERYSYSELFIVIMFFLVYSLHQLNKTKSLFVKISLNLLTVLYIFQSIFWLTQNIYFEFLDHTYEMVRDTSQIINNQTDQNTLVLIDRDQESVFFYPNVERIILHPLKLSFKQNIYKTREISNNPHAKDPPIESETLKNELTNYDQLIILSVSDTPNYQYNEDLKNDPQIHFTPIDNLSYTITFKQHKFRNIFHNNTEFYDFHIQINKISVEE